MRIALTALTAALMLSACSAAPGEINDIAAAEALPPLETLMNRDPDLAPLLDRSDIVVVGEVMATADGFEIGVQEVLKVPPNIRLSNRIPYAGTQAVTEGAYVVYGYATGESGQTFVRTLGDAEGADLF